MSDSEARQSTIQDGLISGSKPQAKVKVESTGLWVHTNGSNQRVETDGSAPKEAREAHQQIL